MTARLLARRCCWLLALPPAAAAQAPRAERPTYAVGDTWVLADATYTLARVERGAYVFTAAGEREIWLTRDLALTYVRRGAETIEIQEPARARRGRSRRASGAPALRSSGCVAARAPRSRSTRPGGSRWPSRCTWPAARSTRCGSATRSIPRSPGGSSGARTSGTAPLARAARVRRHGLVRARPSSGSSRPRRSKPLLTFELGGAPRPSPRSRRAAPTPRAARRRRPRPSRRRAGREARGAAARGREARAPRRPAAAQPDARARPPRGGAGGQRVEPGRPGARGPRDGPARRPGHERARASPASW